MDLLIALLPILGVLIIGIVSPGPSFILVARTAVAVSRAAAVSSALGMAAGASLLATAALLGLSALLKQVPAAFVVLKVVGGLYLLYLAWRAWRSANQPIALVASSRDAGGLVRHFLLAVGTMVSNPKAAVQYGVIFAAMLPAAPAPALIAALPPAVFLLEASWYLLVALALSGERTRIGYLSVKPILDRATAGVLVALGLKLMLSRR